MGNLSQAELQEWIDRSTRLFVKKLSINDRSWADDSSKHQNGFYVPDEVRASGFFPELMNKNTAKPHILMAEIDTFWPATGESKNSRLRHFSNKGKEMHLTRVPKSEFSGLTRASLLVAGRLRKPWNGARYWLTVIDSASELAELLESAIDLPSDRRYALFAPVRLTAPMDEIGKLIAELATHHQNGTLDEFISLAAKLPRPEVFAQRAQQEYLEDHGVNTLNPFELPCPGDAIMKISRDIEFRLYRDAELRHRAAEVIRIITSGGDDIVASVVRGFPELNAAFLSASQHRKSRAGRSFEHHVSRLLQDGGIVFKAQMVTGGRRPDFVLPGVSLSGGRKRLPADGLVLSVKTTLRERWKQITSEQFGCPLFLATVDDRVSAQAIHDMEQQNICLVVPEILTKPRDSVYHGSSNVISFREFFDDQIKAMRPGLLSDRKARQIRSGSKGALLA